MIQVALETSTRHASVCLAQAAKSLGEFTVLPPQVATQSILPALQSMLDERGIRVGDVAQITISIGPGSFTGLRLGIAVAKTFAFATNCRVFQCSTHSVIALQASRWIDKQNAPISKLATVINAQRNQWFAAVHELERTSDSVFIRNSTESAVVDPQTFVDSFASEPVAVCGDGLARPPKGFTIPDTMTTVDQESWLPKASTLAELAADHPQLGQFVDPIKLMPYYGRQSAAEEIAAAKKK